MLLELFLRYKIKAGKLYRITILIIYFWDDDDDMAMGLGKIDVFFVCLHIREPENCGKFKVNL